MRQERNFVLLLGKEILYQEGSDIIVVAAAAKSLQSCLTLCNPIEDSPQGPLSLRFSRQEYWSGLPFPSPMHACMLNASAVPDSVRLHGQQPTRLLCPWHSPGKNTGMGCYFLLQEIFLTQGLNSWLLHWQADSLPVSHLGIQDRQ